MPNTESYKEVDPSPDAHVVPDAPENHNQQYDMPAQEYTQAVAQHEQQEQQEM